MLNRKELEEWRRCGVKFGANLKSIREAKLMTQEELAEKAGVSRVMISMYENGTAEPSAKTKDALCSALGVSARQLEGLEGTADELLSQASRRLAFLSSLCSAIVSGTGKQKKVLAGIFAEACKELADVAHKLYENS